MSIPCSLCVHILIMASGWQQQNCGMPCATEPMPGAALVARTALWQPLRIKSHTLGTMKVIRCSMCVLPTTRCSKLVNGQQVNKSLVIT